MIPDDASRSSNLKLPRELPALLLWNCHMDGHRRLCHNVATSFRALRMTRSSLWFDPSMALFAKLMSGYRILSNIICHTISTVHVSWMQQCYPALRAEVLQWWHHTPRRCLHSCPQCQNVSRNIKDMNDVSRLEVKRAVAFSS